MNNKTVTNPANTRFKRGTCGCEAAGTGRQVQSLNKPEGRMLASGENNPRKNRSIKSRFFS